MASCWALRWCTILSIIRILHTSSIVYSRSLHSTTFDSWACWMWFFEVQWWRSQGLDGCIKVWRSWITSHLQRGSWCTTSWKGEKSWIATACRTIRSDQISQCLSPLGPFRDRFLFSIKTLKLFYMSGEICDLRYMWSERIVYSTAGILARNTLVLILLISLEIKLEPCIQTARPRSIGWS